MFSDAGSLNNSEYQAYIHSARMVDRALQETMPVAHGCGSFDPGATASCNIMPSHLLTFVVPHVRFVGSHCGISGIKVPLQGRMSHDRIAFLDGRKNHGQSRAP